MSRGATRKARGLAPLVVVQAVLAAALLLLVADRPALLVADPPWVWVAAVAVGILVAEIGVFHLEIEGEAHTISLVELPFVVGLLVLPPPLVLAVRMLASGGALILRGQRGIRLAFNLSLFALETALASVLLDSFVSGDDLGVTEVVGIIGVALLVNLIGLVLVAVAIGLSRGGRPIVRPSLIPVQVLAVGSGGALAVVVAASAARPVIAAVAVVPVVGVHLALRAYAGLSERHEDLRTLHEFADRMREIYQPDLLLGFGLAHLRRTVRAEQAFCFVLGGRPGVLHGHRVVDVEGRLHRLSSEVDLSTVVADGRPRQVRLDAADPADPVARVLVELDATEAVVVAVDVQEDLRLVLGVSDRRGRFWSFGEDEVRLVSAFSSYLATGLRSGLLVHQLSERALHDDLTGLANRTQFEQRLSVLVRSTFGARRHAVFILDLDGFKDVNDTLGHHAGDLLLVEIGQRLVSTLRPGDLVARLGGDEFALIVSEVDRDGALEVARRIAEEVRRTHRHDDVDVSVGASIGIALAPDHGSDPTALVQRADVAMYDAKRNRRGIVVYDPSIDQTSTRNLSLVSDLRQALDDDVIDLRYQPRISVGSGDLLSVEALARWTHPRFGAVPPDEFVGLAERHGLVQVLTRSVVDRACAQVRRWSDEGREVSVAVNLSPLDLASPALVDDVTAALDRHGVAPERLTLELTERAVMAEPESAVPRLQTLVDLGVTIAIDDFGTGQSSLSWLRMLPIHDLKIDRSFVTDLGTPDNDRTVHILRAVVELGHGLGLTVTAEGVEDPTSMGLLEELGCDAAQGYGIARPLTATELGDWLAARAGEPAATEP